MMMTLEKRSKTGAMAREASRQTRWKTGFGTVALSVSNGSRMRRNPAKRLAREDVESAGRTFVVRRYERGEGGDFLERGVLVDASELERADE